MKKLRDLGNTVVVVEHDEEIMRSADYLIDVGPDAGRLGGTIIYQGKPAELVPSQAKKTDSLSYTARYLTGELSIPVPKQRRKWRDSIKVIGAKEHNLKDIDVTFPLGVMTVVTGVSGSGRIDPCAREHFSARSTVSSATPATLPELSGVFEGDISRIKNVEFVDQNPIGKSSRSNPATYLKAFDEIRKLFASTQGAKQMGYNASMFSFNSDGGRCEECKGDGYITIESAVHGRHHGALRVLPRQALSEGDTRSGISR